MNLQIQSIEFAHPLKSPKSRLHSYQNAQTINRMRTYKVIYEHGHFIDTETKQRVIPIQGEEYIITGESKSFKTQDAIMSLGEILTREQKKEKIFQEFEETHAVRILDAGSQLYFKIGNNRKAEGDIAQQYSFVCTILEDLYIYISQGKSGEEEEHWRLAECKCILEKCLDGGLTLTDRIPANSLNSLFSHTVQFFFSLQRSSSTNVFTTFNIYYQGMDVKAGGYGNQPYQSLASLRRKTVLRRTEKED